MRGPLDPRLSRPREDLMRCNDRFLRAALIASCAATMPLSLHAASLQVTHLAPARNTVASRTTSVTIDFDKPVDPASINSGTFRVFGRSSGAKSGAFSFSNGNQTVTFQPSAPFSAGETVRINLSHAIAAADLTSLRSAGYA